jgi:hypothetical protein
VTTQLRLVETLVDSPVKTRVKTPVKTPVRTPVKALRVARATKPARRAASWGEWRLDARTRRVGREGVAAARRALDHAQELSQAS